MQQLKLFRTLLTPSPLSLVSVVIIAIVYVSYMSWGYMSNNLLISNYFLGPDGVTMRFWEGSGSYVEWFTKFFSSNVGYYLSLLTVGIIIGIATYTLLQLFSIMIHRTAHFVKYAKDTAEPEPFVELFVQLWMRCLALVGWALFIAVTLSTILPYTHLCINIGASYLQGFDLRGVLPYVQAIIICIMTLHIHIIFARLLLLRPRIFSSYYVDLDE